MEILGNLLVIACTAPNFYVVTSLHQQRLREQFQVRLRPPDCIDDNPPFACGNRLAAGLRLIKTLERPAGALRQAGTRLGDGGTMAQQLIDAQVFTGLEVLVQAVLILRN